MRSPDAATDIFNTASVAKLRRDVACLTAP
jgi:hypothetical protein